jgi:cysteinyl-tRNA synthetase
MATLAFFDQMNGINYQTLSTTNFKLGIVDPDSTGLTASQLSTLEGAGKSVISYLSIGEAEDYRSYWQSSWNTNPPSWMLGENPDWNGNYQVKFWDPAWQKIIIDKAVSLASTGYDGLMLDVVDVYGVSSVASAAGGEDNARALMVTFVKAIAAATKAINPNFKIIQNNALDLLTVNPNDPSSATNTAYLAHIDGVLAESTFYNPNNTKTSWGAWNLQYLDHAVDAGKSVLVIDYPSSSTAQQDFISQAYAHHFVPFVSTQALNSIPSINYQIGETLPAGYLSSVLLPANGGGTTNPPPVEPPPPPPVEPPPAPSGDNIITGTNYDNALNGIATRDQIFGRKGNDIIHGNDGNDYIQGDEGNDTIYGDNGNDALFGNNGSDKIYGGAGNDYMEGNAGADRLEGGAGVDYLYGGDSNDTLIGGAATDGLYGGAGNDKFVFYKGSGNDWINDFQNPGGTTGDIIQISSQIYSTKSQILSHITYQNGHAVIQLDGTNTITVAGVSDNALTSSDFQIV